MSVLYIKHKEIYLYRFDFYSSQIFMTLDANSSVTVLQNGPCLRQKTPSVSTIEASHDANGSVTVAKGLTELWSIYINIFFSLF